MSLSDEERLCGLGKMKVKVIKDGKVLTEIWQEFPSLYYNTWTFGSKTCNLVGSLEQCCKAAIKEYPDSHIEITNEAI